jgi:ABC-2 type transport system permease protein
LSTLIALIAKELRVLARDRHGLLVLFLMPAIFISIMSLVLRAPIAEHNDTTQRVLVIDRDGGALAQQLIAKMSAVGKLQPTMLQGQTAERLMDARLRDGNPQFGLLIPADFGKRMAQRLNQRPNAAHASAGLLTLYYAPTALPQARTLFRVSVTAILESLQGQQLFARLLGGDMPQATADALQVPVTQAVVGNRAEARMPNAVQQSVPAWLVFAMFFVVIPISTALIVERQQGSLLRLRSLGIPALSVMFARLPPYYLVNLVQMLVMLAVGVWVVPLLGGDRLAPGHSPFGLFLIGSATSVAAIGFALLIAAIARTSMQATTFGGVANLVLGAVGGVMVPKAVMTPLMQHVADYSPMAWALNGFLNIILRGEGWGSVLPDAGRLVLFGLACLGLAAAFFARGART